MLTFFIILCCLLFILLCISIYFLIRFIRILFNIEENMQQSVDILEESHNVINEILQRPLFFDSPEVRSVLERIKASQEAILIATQNITSEFTEEDDGTR